MSYQTISQLPSVKKYFCTFFLGKVIRINKSLTGGLTQYISAITTLDGILDLFVLDDAENH